MYAEAGDIDRGWAWMILLGTFVGATLTGTTLYGSSIINTALLEEYKGSVAYTSLIGSLFTSLLALLGPISSVCINLLGNRVTTIIGAVLVFIGFSTSFFVTQLDYMLITYGLIAGVGFGFYATPVMVCLGKYFNRRRGLASGLFMTGGGLGMFISGPLIQFLVEKYSLRGAMLIIGALMSNLILVGAVMRPSSVEIEETRLQKRNRAETNMTLKEKLSTLIHIDIFKNISFLFVMAQYFSWNLSFSMITLHLTNFAVVKGSSKSEAAFLLTILGLSHTIGRFLGGIFIGPNGFDPLLLNIGCCGLTGLSSILLPLYSSTYEGQILFAILFGFYSGGICILNVPLCANFVQLAHLSTAIGFFFFIGGIGYLIGPPIAGAIIDNGGMYEHSFFLAGLMLFLSVLLTLFSTLFKQKAAELPTTTEEKMPSMDHLRLSSAMLSGSGIISGSMTLYVPPPSTPAEDTTELNHSTKCSPRSSILNQEENGSIHS